LLLIEINDLYLVLVLLCVKKFPIFLQLNINIFCSFSERHRNRSLSPFGSETQESLGSIDLTLTPTSSPDRSRSRSRSTEHSTAESTKFAELADFKDLLTVAK
jgi:cytoskeletal protein RodZ